MVIELQSRPGHNNGLGRPALASMLAGMWAWSAAAGGLYFLAAWLAVPLTTPEGVAQFWPASGIAIGFLIVLGRTARLPVAAGIALASILANVLTGRTAPASFAFALGNVGEALLVAALIERWFPQSFELDRFRNVLGLFGAAAIGTVAWQAVAAVAIELSGHTAAPLIFLWSRLVWANIAGIVMVAPLVIGLAAATRKPPSRQEVIEGTAVLAFHALASAHAFALLPLGLGRWMLLAPFTSQLPLLLWLSVRCGPLFAATGSLVLGLSILGSFTLERGRFADANFPLDQRLAATDFAMLATAFVALAIAALIAERKDAELAASQSRARLKLSLDAGRLGLWELDAKTGSFEATKRARTCFGVTENSSLSLGAISETFHPGDRELWQSQLQRVCEEGAELDVECRARAADGSVRWLHITGQMVGDGVPDTPLRVAGAVRDITEQKLITSLKENVERLRWFVEQAPVAIVMLDRDMRYMAVSHRWRADYGLGEALLIGRSHYEVFPEVTRFWREVHQRGLAGETLRDERDPFTRADGSVQWLSWEVRPWHDASGAVGGIFIVSEDITSKIKAERALSESREDLNRAQAVAHTGSWRLNVRTNKLSWSDETCRMFGVSPTTELTYQSFLDVVHPIDRERVDQSWKAALGGAPYDIEYRVIADGVTKWIHARSELEFDSAGKVLGGFGTVQDITDKKQAEEALRQSEERLRAIVDTAVDAIIVIDEAGLIESINPAAERVFGYAASDIMGENISVLMAGTHRAAHDSYISAYRRTGKAKIIGVGREVEGRRKDGSTFPVDLTIAEWQVAGKRHFTGIVRDISERKRQEEKVALLLREVNHRAKNMLALVQAIASQTAVPKSGEFVERFSERLAALAASQDLLVMSGWQGVNASELVRSQLSHFQELIDDRIKLAGPSLNLSAAGAQAIGMAVHELATNAGKYGALSNSAGTIEIGWRLDRTAQSAQFTLSWVEAGGPPVPPPKKSGFGTTVIEAMPRMELDAEVTLIYAPEGLCWRLECPAERVVEIPPGLTAMREASPERKQ